MSRFFKLRFWIKTRLQPMIRAGILVLGCTNVLMFWSLQGKGRCWIRSKTSSTSPLFSKVPMQSQETEQSCIYVHGVSMLPMRLQFFDSTLEQFRHCGISCFSFYVYYVLGYWFRFCFHDCLIRFRNCPKNESPGDSMS